MYRPDMKNCAGFQAADAAELLGVPVARVTARAEELYAGNWICSFATGEFGKDIVFNVSIGKRVQDAVDEMDQYRSHLQTAGGTTPFKDKAKQGAYRAVPIGDDALWTEINGTLTVRQGNVTLQVQAPADQGEQIRVARRFLGKL